MQGKSDPNLELLTRAALCLQLAPNGSMYAFLADHLAELLPSEDSADLVPRLQADVRARRGHGVPVGHAWIRSVSFGVRAAAGRSAPS